MIQEYVSDKRCGNCKNFIRGWIKPQDGLCDNVIAGIRKVNENWGVECDFYDSSTPKSGESQEGGGE